jgi:hypothetical protein
MRLTILAALLCSSLALPAWAGDNEPKGQMVVLKANQIGQIFCLSRIGNDEAVIAGILTADLAKTLAAAEKKNDDYASKHPDEKPPLGDGIPWQSTPDYADTCDIGLVTLSKADAKVEIKYGFTADPKSNYVDTLILKKLPIEGTDVGYWRIDDVIFPDGSDLRKSLAGAFDTYQ